MSATRPGIELDDISMSFGTNQVLRGVSLHLEPGRVTGRVESRNLWWTVILLVLVILQIAAGVADSWERGARMAEASIDEGKGAEALERLRTASNR